MQRYAGLAVAAMLLAAPTQAEIVKTAAVACKSDQICLYWWPKLPALKGWHSDQNANFQMGDNGSNILIPDGKTFASAPAIIYARAIFIERYDGQFKIKSTLDGFIKDDVENFKANGATVGDGPALKTADGEELKVVTFSKGDNFECVAYGQEDGYYRMFVLSANSEAAYKQTLPVYQDLVARYRP